MLIKRLAASLAISLTLTALSFAALGDWALWPFIFWASVNTLIILGLHLIANRL